MKRLWTILFTGVPIEFSQNYLTPALQALPEAPAGWTRVTQTVLDPIPHERPETSHAQKAWRATYGGKSQVTLTLYAMPWSPGNAWDAIQRWRQVLGAVAFAKGRYFGVAASEGADETTLKRFVQGAMATLPRGGETIR